MKSAPGNRMLRRSIPPAIMLAATLIASPAPAQKAAQAEVLLDAAAAKPLLANRD